MKKLAVLMGLLAVVSFAPSCGSSGGDAMVVAPYVAGPMARCMPAGTVNAGMIFSPAEYIVGLDYYGAVGNHERSALNSVGDFMLINNKAAFVIQKVDWRDSYFPFGGNIIDAVAIDNCYQAGPEQFQELQMLVGMLDIVDLPNSFLRAVSPDSVVVLNDGTDGNPAIVRIHGTEEIFHTVENNLQLYLPSMGMPYISPPPLNLDIVIDYVLEPDSNVLRIELTVTNTLPLPIELLDGMAMFYGDTTQVKYPNMGEISVAGYGLAMGTPWMVGSNGTGAWGVAMPDALMSGVNISGLTAAVDFNMIPPPIGGGAAIALAAAGDPGDTHTFVRFFGVGPTDYNSLIDPLLDEIMPEPLPGAPVTKEDFYGTVYDYVTQEPIEGAMVYLEMFNGTYYVFDTGLITDENGEFSGQIPYWGPAAYQIRVEAPGRMSPTPLVVTFPIAGSIDIPLMPGGQLYYEIRDDDGNLMPAKILLWQSGNTVKRIYPGSGMGFEEVAPGTYTVTVTRGYEYEAYQGVINIPFGGDHYLEVTLDKLVNTDGFMSFDGHIHSGRSPDNYISVEERVRSCSAEGVEVSVATDHDFIGSWQWAIDMWGLNAWQVNVAGSEVTAPVPGHTNIYPIEPRFDIDARGGWVQWMLAYDTEELLEWNRARTIDGEGIVSLNHPRSGLTSSTVYDPTIGLPTLPDPAMIGQPADATIWTWNFDSIELQNGMQNPFKDPADPVDTGTFEDWMSFLNTGHLTTAIGVSDAHNHDLPGYARSYYRSPTDSTLDFNVDDLVDAVMTGNTFVSTGAFARILLDGTAEMGDTITDADGTVDVWLHVEANPVIDVTYLKVFVNCDEYANVVTADPYGLVKYSGVFQISGLSQDAHVVVMGFGADMLPLGLPQFDPTSVPRFTTNAIYVDYDGNGVFDAPGAKACSYTIP